MAQARIVGRVGTATEFEQLDEVISNFPVTLGRAESSKDGDINHICIGRKETTISRKHGKIFWDEESKSFKLECLSKNGCTVDGKNFGANEVATIQSKSALRLGSARFYFLLPVKKPEQVKEAYNKGPNGQVLSYSDMLEAAYQSSNLDLSGGGATQREIIDWILVNFPTFMEDNKRQNLQQGIYVALNKYYDRVTQPPGEKVKLLRWRKRIDTSDEAYGADEPRKKQKV